MSSTKGILTTRIQRENLSWGRQESALDDVRPALNVIVAREARLWKGGWNM